MKQFILPLLLSLSACSTCYIPYGEYESSGGTESVTTLVLSSEAYTLTFEHWKPTGYESRSQITEQGKWSCVGSAASISTKKGMAKAEIQEVGENPLGLPLTTRALVFEPSDNDVLSREILYPSESLK